MTEHILILPITKIWDEILPNFDRDVRCQFNVEAVSITSTFRIRSAKRFVVTFRCFPGKAVVQTTI